MEDKSDEEFDEIVYEEEEGGFDLGQCLDAPQAKFYTTRQLHTMIHEGLIDLNPPYQREVVWPEPKQVKLVDSLWRNFYVPPVVFAVYNNEEGEEVRCCVDGKQRLTSIQKFIDGQVHKHWRTGQSWWYTTAHTMKKARTEVPKNWKDDFCAKTITCVEYHGLPSGQERDIFQRVQMGVPLRAAEKLQALSSPWSELIDELVQMYVVCEDGLPAKINVTIKRGQDFQLIAGLLYCCHQLPEQGQPTSGNIEKWLTGNSVPHESFKSAISDTLKSMWYIGDTPSLNHGFTEITKRVAPVEFVFIGVLLYLMRDRPYLERADAILDMRQSVRKKYQDIRSKHEVFKEMWIYIDSVAERRPDVKSKGKGKKRKAPSRNDADDMDVDEGPSIRRKPRKK
ncbi:uncharacterized protein BXZ73DRAFT_42719 [Epithele typhae]|uniref:uncharacterized protein n=1 Tax=Epithele typhae TaxID=378194 RepID=UPI002007439E|nr:uncharacterized protein BXZ73DRAFT_42719 [Epithele typhae]KAH9940454.1 hypothetical protein BXZ73DRAFT_42719 [Epithele typhae]